MKRTTSYLLMVAAMTVLIFAGITPAISSSSGDTVRVFVEYSQGHKHAVGNALKATNARFHYEFDDLSSFVVTIPAAALNGIQRNPHVTGIEEDVPRYPIASTPAKRSVAPLDTIDDNGQPIPYGIDAVQARDVWDADRDAVVDPGAPTGAGRTVCIIDTGYYSDHEDLVALPPESGFSQVDDDWRRDGYGHGTHVAGTVSALNNEVGVVGVTPGTVDFFIIKYFDDSGAASMASDLIAAINTCADNGASVINMSLGGSRSARREQRAFDSLYAQGILSIAAAGNDGNTAYSYPASYDSVMSVAAIDEANDIADFSQQNDQVEIAAPGVAVLSTLPYTDTSTLSVDGVDYAANHIEYSARSEDGVSVNGALVDGYLCDSTSTSWNGNVVLCERGDISFYDKVMNVQNSGGAAAVIYNNESGNFFGTLGDDDSFSSEIIGITLSQEDGQYLVANKLNYAGTVESLFDWPASGYQAWDGTSMATPHVVGVAALIWSADPTLTNVEIREAMNATALDLGDTGLDNAYGHGLVQAYDALDYLGLAPVPVDNPPVVSITSPTNGTSFVSGVPITFTGTAIDIEEGDLAPALDWSSDLDGSIGTGGSFFTDLSEGTHTITASVTDSSGNPGSDSIEVTVTSSGTGGELDVSVTTNEPVYVNRDRVYVTVTVSDTVTSAPIAGASVDWSITFPKLTASGTTVTDASGDASFSYRINTRKTGIGTATVDASVTVDGETATGSATFEVQ